MHRVRRPSTPIPTLAALAALFLLASCSAGVTLAVNPDGSGSLSVDARVPEAAAARLRSLASGGSVSPVSAPLVDPEAVRREAARRGLTAVSAESPGPDRFRGSFSVRSLAALAADPEIAGSGILRIAAADGVTSLSFGISRKNAESLPLLFPGLDPYLLEALSPPALDPYPVTAGEYREMLRALLGPAALAELEAAEIRVQVRAPGPVVRHSGGSISDRTLTAAIRLMDLLVLERPIEFSLAWR